MARVKTRNTGPELALQRALQRRGLGNTPHGKAPAGRPDLIVEGLSLAVFIDGCFWHGCPLHYTKPGNHGTFWATKLRTTVERDVRQTAILEDAGWKVVRIWEHDVAADLEGVVAHVLDYASNVENNRAPLWRVVRVEEVAKEGRIERRYLVDLRRPSERIVVEGRRDENKRPRLGKG